MAHTPFFSSLLSSVTHRKGSRVPFTSLSTVLARKHVMKASRSRSLCAGLFLLSHSQSHSLDWISWSEGKAEGITLRMTHTHPSLLLNPLSCSLLHSLPSVFCSKLLTLRTLLNDIFFRRHMKDGLRERRQRCDDLHDPSLLRFGRIHVCVRTAEMQYRITVCMCMDKHACILSRSPFPSLWRGRSSVRHSAPLMPSTPLPLYHVRKGQH